MLRPTRRRQPSSESLSISPSPLTLLTEPFLLSYSAHISDGGGGASPFSLLARRKIHPLAQRSEGRRRRRRRRGRNGNAELFPFSPSFFFSEMGEEASRFYVAAPMIPLPPPPFFPASKSLPAESGNGGGSIVSYGALIFTCRRRRHCPLFTTEQTEAEATPFLFLPIPFFAPLP